MDITNKFNFDEFLMGEDKENIRLFKQRFFCLRGSSSLIYK